MTTPINKDEDPMDVARTVPPESAVAEELYECANCAKKYRENELVEMTGGFWERHQPGDMVGAGECPDCGALCFPLDRLIDKRKLSQIEDIIVNQYAEDDGPFTKKQLEQILDGIVQVMDAKRTAKGKRIPREGKVCNKAIDGGRCGLATGHKGKHLWPGEMRTVSPLTRAMTRHVRAERR